MTRNSCSASSARFRLPFEGEWVKAARYNMETSTFSTYAFGSDLDPVPAQLSAEGDVLNAGPWCVNFDTFINGRPSSVGQCGNRSYFGAADMNGNVAEFAISADADPPANFLRHYGGAFNSSKTPISVSPVLAPTASDPYTGFLLPSVCRMAGRAVPHTPGRPVEILSFSRRGGNARLVFSTRAGRTYDLIGSRTI